MNNYDYIIIGGGPSALTLGWILGSNKKKVLIIEKEKQLGGCHRVMRKNNYFTEHGPRIYSDSYLYFIELLKDMNLKFEDLFVPYIFQISKINEYSPLSFKLFEYFAFIKAFIYLIINKDYGKTTSIKTFMEDNNFSNETILYIDRLCKLTDGATYDKYTLNQFLQLVNQQLLYGLYQPVLPNDRGLIKQWTDKIIDTNYVDIILNEEVITLNRDKNKITSVITNKNIYYGNEIILTIPPKPLYKLIKSNNLFDSLNMSKYEFFNWTKENSYFNYICLTYHYNKKIDFPKMWGFIQSKWDIVFIILSNYMDLTSTTEPSKTIISIAITNVNMKNDQGKTVNDCTYDELIEEVKKQLPYFPKPDKIILAPNIKYINGKWINEDTAFVESTNNKYLDYKTKIDNLYIVGTHNGHSKYKFTSLESAVQNAIYFIKKEKKNLKCNVRDKDMIELRNIIIITIIIVIVMITIYKFYK
jgi:UDP-galactopyranose mutase